MNVVSFAIKVIQGRLKMATDACKNRSESIEGIGIKDFSPVLGDKDQVSMNSVNNVSTMSKFVLHLVRPMGILGE